MTAIVHNLQPSQETDYATALPPPLVRRCTLFDIKWMKEMVSRHFEDQDIDLAKTENYWVNTMSRPNYMYLRGPKALGAAYFYRPYWLKDTARPVAWELFFCADPGGVFELVKIIRMMVKWSKDSGCSQFKVTEGTGLDLSAIAKRVGAKTVGSYVIKF